MVYAPGGTVSKLTGSASVSRGRAYVPSGGIRLRAPEIVRSIRMVYAPTGSATRFVGTAARRITQVYTPTIIVPFRFSGGATTSYVIAGDQLADSPFFKHGTKGYGQNAEILYRDQPTGRGEVFLDSSPFDSGTVVVTSTGNRDVIDLS
jgi:hypothetical protein